MNKSFYVASVVIFGAALLSAEASAQAQVQWTNYNGPEDWLISIAVGEGGFFERGAATLWAAGDNGIYESVVSQGTWSTFAPNFVALQIAADTSGGVYAISESGTIWRTVVVQTHSGKFPVLSYAFEQVPNSTIPPGPNGGSTCTSIPKDIAIYDGGSPGPTIYVVACNQIWSWAQNTGQWGVVGFRNETAAAVAAGENSELPWVVDTAFHTWAVDGAPVAGNPNEVIQNYGHSLAIFGTGTQNTVAFGITGGVFESGNYQVCEWNGSWTCPVGGSWSQPTAGGWGTSISASGNMVAVLNAQNEIWIDTGD
jgi:hypothetical protein